MIQREKILDRKLPDLIPGKPGLLGVTIEEWEKRREEIKDILQKEEYGYFPEKPLSYSVELPKTPLRSCAGFAEEFHAKMNLILADGTPFSFPFHFTLPKTDKPVPAILHINFYDFVPNRYMPVEELVENGYAVFSFCYNDVTTDNDDFNNGLAQCIYKGRERGPKDPGKIVLWSWAASRICDYMMTRSELDPTRFLVTGHSRLGKTALLTAAFDERFTWCASNDAGCSGDAPMRGKIPGNERVWFIHDRFPFWFCPEYKKYTDEKTCEEAPFDQHYLLALIAPRFLMIGSAEDDLWADPAGQYLSAVAAGDVWRLYGIEPGLMEDNPVEKPFEYSDGSVGFHYREGAHFYSRRDWLAYLRFLEKHPNRLK